MTTFQDGPAQGKTLMLRRAVRFLRVVQSVPTGEFDALDQPEDRPNGDELLFAYEIVGTASWMHLNKGGKPGGGMFAMATYKHVPEQPKDIEMRDPARWHDWVMLRVALDNCRPRTRAPIQTELEL